MVIAQCRYRLHDYIVESLPNQRYHIKPRRIEAVNRMEPLEKRAESLAKMRMAPPPTDDMPPPPPLPSVCSGPETSAMEASGSATATVPVEPVITIEMPTQDEIAAMARDYEQEYQVAYQQALQELQQQDQRFPKSTCPVPSSLRFSIEKAERPHLFPQGERIVTVYTLSLTEDVPGIGYPFLPMGSQIPMQEMNNLLPVIVYD